MKRCPTCNRSFDDNSLSFCLDDGTPLITDAPASSTGGVLPPTQTYNVGGKETVSASHFDVPHPYLTPPAPSRRRAWPWVVAILAVLFIVIVAVVLIALAIPRMTRTSRADEPLPPTPLRSSQTNEPWQSPSPAPDTASSEDEMPTDKAEVLASVKKVEEDWQRANLKADKDALDEILADEYIGGANSHNKQQYIKEITPDTSVNSWEYQNLSVSQSGRRATAHGNLKQETDRGPEVYEFTDTFVWRGHRWQAVSSHTTRVK